MGIRRLGAMLLSPPANHQVMQSSLGTPARRRLGALLPCHPQLMQSILGKNNLQPVQRRKVTRTKFSPGMNALTALASAGVRARARTPKCTPTHASAFTSGALCGNVRTAALRTSNTAKPAAGNTRTRLPRSSSATAFPTLMVLATFHSLMTDRLMYASSRC